MGHRRSGFAALVIVASLLAGHRSAEARRSSPAPLETKETLVQTLSFRTRGAAPAVSVREKRTLRAKAVLPIGGADDEPATKALGIRIGDFRFETTLADAVRWTSGTPRASWVVVSEDPSRPGVVRVNASWTETSLRLDLRATGEAPVAKAHESDRAGELDVPFEAVVQFGKADVHLGGRAEGRLARTTAEILGAPVGLARVTLAGKAQVLSTAQDGSAPRVDIVSPATESVSTFGDDVIVSGTATDNRSLAGMTLAIGNSAETSVPFVLVPGSGGLGDALATWSATIRPPVGRSTIRVNAYDGAGNRGSASIELVVDPVVVVEPDAPVAPSISAGMSHVVFKDASGKVQVWGDLNQSAPTAPEFVASLDGVLSVAAGSDLFRPVQSPGPLDFGLALMDDGRLRGWGAGGYGQIGNSRPTYLSSSWLVSDLDQVVRVEAVGLGPMALRADGTLWMWGSGGFGVFGEADYGVRVTPSQVPGLPKIRDVASNGQTSYALDEDGFVWRWGSDDTWTATTASPTKMSGVLGILSLHGGGSSHPQSGGAAAVVAIANDETAWTWGVNTYGRLGHPTAANEAPAQVIRAIGGVLQGVSTASSGVAHTLFLTTTGEVWACGCSSTGPQGGYDRGQIGTGIAAGHLLAVKVPGLPKAVAIAAGRFSSYAVLEDGRVMAWGANDKGQLGDGTTQDRPTPVEVVLAK